MTPGRRHACNKGARDACGAFPLAALCVCLAVGASPASEASPIAPTEVISAKGLEGFVKAERLPLPSAPFLAKGRAVWAEDCQNCHGGDPIVGAPKITSTKNWAKRIDKGLPALFAQAKQGFLGPTYKEMPARGGNSDLSDAEVEAAVAFMVWTSGGAAEVEAWLAARAP